MTTAAPDTDGRRAPAAAISATQAMRNAMAS